jgi:hypothetical protein
MAPQEESATVAQSRGRLEKMDQLQRRHEYRLALVAGAEMILARGAAGGVSVGVFVGLNRV